MDESAARDEREIRAARNQSMFREINERLTRDDATAETTGSHVIACECADTTCVETLGITAAQYAEVRREPRHFAVLPGHLYPDVERVVAEFTTYVVVEKLRLAAEVAEALEDNTLR
jgi:hypothetical protein